MSLEHFFPRSFDAKRAHFSAPMTEALTRVEHRDANSVHFGRRINMQRHEIYNGMSARDIVSMLGR